MAAHAESIGVEIFPGFTAAEVLYNDDGAVKGVATGNLGIGKDGEPTDNFQLGMELHAKYTIFAEGARGHLGKQLIAKYNLAEAATHKAMPSASKSCGKSILPKPSLAWWCTPLAGPCKTTPLAAAFCTTWKTTKSPSALCWASTTKTHGSAPLKKCNAGKHTLPLPPTWKVPSALGYGARAINNGTPQALPKTVFPGGALIGCDAGYLNAARIKGSHAAIKSGMLAAEAAYEAVVSRSRQR